MKSISALAGAVALSLFLSIPAATHAGDWPHFLGPNHDSHSIETGLLRDFPSDGLEILWEVERGAGHAPPVIAGDALVFVHGKGETEVIECLERQNRRIPVGGVLPG